MVSAMWGFAVVAGLMTLVPGVDTAIVVQSGIRGGRRLAYSAVLGISLGVLIWGVSAAMGLSALLLASPIAYDIVRYAGALYLVYLGIRTIVRSLRPTDGTEPHLAATATPMRTFRMGLLTNLMNPKIGVFYVAILPQFMPAGVAPYISGSLLSLVHVIEGVVWFSVLIWGTHLVRERLQQPNVRAWIERITGAALVGFGLRVALASH